MKKLIAIALSVSVALAMLTGCGETSADEGGSDEFRTDSRFKEVEYCSLPSLRGATIYVDTETGVMYMYVVSGYAGGLSVMLDAEGNPLIWRE